MIPFFQLDAATLAMWINFDLLNEQPNPEIFTRILTAVRSSDDEELVAAVFKLPEAERGRAIAIASSFWHEKRHFLDLVLTNYGAFRFRQFFEAAMNIPALVRAAKASSTGRLTLPVEIYADRVRMRRAGIEPNADLQRIGQAVANRKRAISDDRAQFPSRYGPLEVGGEAQLEALAYLHQSAKTQTLFGVRLAAAALDSVPNSDSHHGKYRWIFDLALGSGVLLVERIDENVMLFDDALMVCSLYGALACRVWKQEQKITETSSSYLPNERLASIMVALRGERRGRKEIVPFEEAWALVNKVCKEIFDRSIIEETEIDWELAQRNFEGLKEIILPSLFEIVMEFQELRRRLINQLKTDPHSVLVAKSFQERLLDRLQPRSLYCSPKGNLKMSQGFEAMFSYDHARSQPEVTSPVAKWVWVMTEAKSPWYEDESAFLLRRPEWMTFISDTAPIAKLLADGRHRRDMLGCESTHAEARLRTVLDMEVDIDPLFQSPDDQFDLSAYLYLIGKSDAPCDLSGARVNAASGTMFSKWELLNKPEFVEAIIQFWARGWPSDAAAWMQFWKDWSPWIVAKEFSPANGIEAFRKALDELSARS